MNTTLVCSQKSPLYLANFSPWKPMAPFIIPTSIQKTLNNPPSTWKAQANAKGFGSTPPSVQETSIKKTSSDADDEKIPEEVMYRIIKRVLASVGAPMTLSFASMQLIGLIMEQHIWNVPKWFMFLTLFLTLGASVCGIAYGALSTSMDPNEKGSFLGFEQIQKNWVEMWREEDRARNPGIEKG